MTALVLSLTEVEALPAATLDDMRAVRAYLLGRLEGHSQKVAEADFNVMAQVLGYEDISQVAWTQLRDEHVSYLLRQLMTQAGYKPESVNRLRGTLMGMFRRAKMKRLISPERYEELASVPRVACEPNRPAAGRALSEAEVAKLLAVCEADETPAGKRDRCLLVWFWATGMRLAEVVGVDLAHVDLERGLVEIRRKGGKRQTVPLAEDLVAAVKEYLAARGRAPGPLFYSARGRRSRSLMAARLSEGGVQHIFLRLARLAQVARFSPHDLRRTFAGDLFDAGADEPSVQRLMGHASASMTAAYDRRGLAAERRAVAKRKLPTAENSRDLD